MKPRNQVIYVLIIISLILVIIFGLLQMILPVVVFGFTGTLLGLLALLDNKK